jgi:mono/diheme cytochrome c family protein
MMKQWIEPCAVLGCALLALSIARNKTNAQGHDAQSDHPQTNILTLEGPAIHIVVTAHLSPRELRKLVTDSRTAHDHPDLAKYYRIQSDRLNLEAEECQRMARAMGDPKPLNAPDHYNIGRNARHYHVIAKESLKRAQSDNLLAALYAQAAQGEGCFSCHSLHGRGGEIGPDLAIEGSRGRSNGWLIGHFKDPQAYSSTSVMPALAGLSNPQLEALASFVQYQKEK